MSHDNWAWSNWFKIKKYLEHDYRVNMKHHGLLIGTRVMIAKKTTRFKIMGVPLWAHYTPKTMAEALNRHDIVGYYLEQLKSPKSSNNPLQKGQTLDEWRAEQGSNTDYFKHYRELLNERKPTKPVLDNLEDAL